MPNDADSLTEPEVDDLLEAGDLADTAVDAVDGVDTEFVDAAEALAADVEEAATAVNGHAARSDDDDDESSTDTDTDAADVDVDAAEALATDVDDGDADADELDPDDPNFETTADSYSPYPDELDEYDYDDEFDAALFDGDPDEFDLGFGMPPATPTPGDVMVIDEPAEYRPRPQRRPRPMSRAERRRRVRLQARRVRRIIRHVEPWSVLKISLLFYACLWVIFLVAGFMVWGVAESSGTVGKLESLVRDLFALDTFSIDAGQIFKGYAWGGLALAIAGTTFNVLMCLLFNLISDLTGGLRITMIEEETARPVPPRRRRRRRPPPRR